MEKQDEYSLPSERGSHHRADEPVGTGDGERV